MSILPLTSLELRWADWYWLAIVQSSLHRLNQRLSQIVAHHIDVHGDKVRLAVDQLEDA